MLAIGEEDPLSYVFRLQLQKLKRYPKGPRPHRFALCPSIPSIVIKKAAVRDRVWKDSSNPSKIVGCGTRLTETVYDGDGIR
jgi:hypothetical protein